MLTKFKGVRTYVVSCLIVASGVIISYNQGCENEAAELVEACKFFTFPGWLVSILGVAAAYFRSLVNTEK